MPDAGDFGTRDTAASPANWSEAFAALPQERPDAGGWQRLQARLPMPAARSRTRWPVWLAVAAALALALAVPLRMLPQADKTLGQEVVARHSREGGNPWALTETPTIASHAPLARATLPPAKDVPPPRNKSMDSRLRGNDERRQTDVASRATPRRAIRIAPSQRPVRTAAEPAGSTRVATAVAPAIDMAPLYARSAQLESLLVMARDERVANGTRAALSDALDGRVAAIDATLAQAGLSDAQRAHLWEQRLDALQRLVGIETTNRLYAARGQRHDFALVSID